MTDFIDSPTESFVTGPVRKFVAEPADRAGGEPGSRAGGEAGSGLIASGSTAGPGQITERDFLVGLAKELTDRFSSIGQGEARTYQQAAALSMLGVIREKVIGPNETLERWLREWLAIGPRSDLTVEGLYQMILRRAEATDLSVVRSLFGTPPDFSDPGAKDLPVAAASIIAIELGTASWADAVVRKVEDWASSLVQQSSSPNVTAAALPTAALLNAAPCLALAAIPSGSLPSTSAIGQLVHGQLQMAYLAKYLPLGHKIMTERMVSWLGGGSSVADLGLSALDPRFTALRYALMTFKGLTKLPDILDLTTREVYEIKPRRQVRDGLAQLWLNYLIPYAVVAPVLGLPLLQPGSRWIPPPFIPVPPNMIAVTYTCPGLIVYDLYEFIPRGLVFAPQPATVKTSNNEQIANTATVVAVVVVMIIVALLFWYEIAPLLPILMPLFTDALRRELQNPQLLLP